jgi:predicted secreted acid phosphatase
MSTKPANAGNIRRRFRVGAAIFLLLVCTNGAVRAEGGALFVTTPSQPLNVGDAIIAATAYHDSGAYDRDVALVARQAVEWISERAPSARRPALVLDVDDTALSNWEVITRDNFGRPIGGPCDLALDGPCGWAAWDELGQDPAIGPTLQLFQKARAMGVTVFFITGRPENQRQATERNLATVGYEGYEKLYAVPNGANFSSATDFKAPIRAEIEQAGFTIIANMGDQPSDLFGGHAERMFLLPNPFYRVR